MPTYSDTKVDLVINKPSQSQFDSATGLDPTELYFVEPNFSGNKLLQTSATGDIVESTVDPTKVISRNSVTDTTSTSITLSNAVAGTDYHYGTLTSLTVTANDTSDNEITIYFTAGSTIAVSLPQTLEYIGSAPVFEANTKYAISILNNICIAGAIG